MKDAEKKKLFLGGLWTLIIGLKFWTLFIFFGYVCPLEHYRMLAGGWIRNETFSDGVRK